MATNVTKWDHKAKEEEEDEDEEEEEEEALSLCDLPVINERDEHKSRKQCSHKTQEEGEDFDFRSLSGLFSEEEPQMCAADEVFFQGQILPLRFEPGLLTKDPQTQSTNNGKQFNRHETQSNSTGRESLGEFRCSSTNSSSRSSSIRSQNSSSSASSISKPKIRNQFHTIPSPKPQLRQSISYSSNNQVSRKSSSSAWEFFRLGVVPAPEIGLQDLKVRNNANRNCVVSRNSSSSSSSNSTNSNCNNAVKSKAKKMSNKTGNHLFKQFVGKSGGLLSGCNCTVEEVMQLDMIKSGGTTNYKSGNKTESATHAVKEKVVELKKKQTRHNSSSNRKKEVKKVMSRRRTFEWLKELHTSDEEEVHLLSNP